MRGQDHGTITPATLHPGRPNTPDFSPRQGRPGSSSRQLSSKKFLSFQHSLLTPLPPPPSTPLPAWSGAPFAAFLLVQAFLDLQLSLRLASDSSSQDVTATQWCRDSCASVWTRSCCGPQRRVPHRSTLPRSFLPSGF